MPNDNLAPVARAAISAAEGLLNGRGANLGERKRVVTQLEDVRDQLHDDIEERRTNYPTVLASRENSEINNCWVEFNAEPGNTRKLAKQSATSNKFEELRRINQGSFPLNMSPVIYIIPLIGFGLGEFYVNYATFAYTFVPVLAFICALLTAVVFATASHIHGTYIKQIAEIRHPSVEYSRFVDRKIALFIITASLIMVLGLVLWLRYDLLASQLGVSGAGDDDVFGASSVSKVYTK